MDSTAARRIRVSVCIPTRNRGASVASTLDSLRRLDHDSFQVIVVDQSTDGLSREVYSDLVGDDPRFTRLDSDSVGASAARNLAVERAIGSIIAFTDDDCVVPPDWLSEIERILAAHPDVMLLCGALVAGDYDHAAGAMPTFIPERLRVFRSPWIKYRARGIGANLAVRSEALRHVGRFDELLGPGGCIGGCEDGDLVYRFLRAGYAVLETPQPAVVHQGFRTWSELRILGRRALLGCGAVCMKHLRLGDPAIMPTLLVLWFRRTLRWHNVLRLRRPVGLALFTGFGCGLVRSFRYPIDRRTRTYVGRETTRAGTNRVDVTPAKGIRG
jgi:glycosyltransferase involved in cell wall biosynthesis